MRASRLAIVPALVALAAVVAAPASGQDTTSVCHYTGDPQAPYQLIQTTPVGVETHVGHDLDVVPAPPLGCPTFPPPPEEEETPEPSPVPTEEAPTTICHFGIGGRFETFTLTAAELEVHADHDRDLIPAPAAGCPARAGGGGDDDEPVSDDGESGGGGGDDGGGVAGAGAESAAQPASAPAAPAATGSLAAGLPVTGARPDVILLLGLAFLLGGAGLRLRLLAGR